MPRISWDYLEFADCRGVPRQVNGCSTGDFAAVLSLYDWLVAELNTLWQADPDVTFEQLYISSGIVRNLVNQLLSKCGIDPDWLSPNQTKILIVGRYDADGTPQKGALISYLTGTLQQERSGKAPAEPLTPAQYAVTLQLQLVQLGICKTLDEAAALSMADAEMLLDAYSAQVQSAKDRDKPNSLAVKDTDPERVKRAKVAASRGKEGKAELFETIFGRKPEG